MKWPTTEALAAITPLHEGYRFARLDRGNVPALIAALREWHPQISVGTSSCYLREDFYRDRVCLDGNTDKDILGVPILFGDRLIGFWSFEREVDSLAIWGRLIVLAPEHRGAKVSVHALTGTEGIGRFMGAAFLYAFASLKNTYSQQALERAGYRLLGFFPGRDREEVSPGVVKRVYQSVYAKLLVPPEHVHWPDPKNLSPRARTLFAQLFPERSRDALSGAGPPSS
jgi:RimJ/RimL family protein N-acetyltransferase